MNKEIPTAGDIEKEKKPVDSIEKKASAYPQSVDRNSLNQWADKMEAQFVIPESSEDKKAMRDAEKAGDIRISLGARKNILKQSILEDEARLKIINNGGKISGIETDLIKDLSSEQEKSRLALLKILGSESQLLASLPEIAWEGRNFQDSFRELLAKSIGRLPENIFDTRGNTDSKIISPFFDGDGRPNLAIDLLDVSLDGKNNVNSKYVYKNAIWEDKKKEEQSKKATLRMPISGHLSVTFNQESGTVEILSYDENGNSKESYFVEDKERAGYHKPTAAEKKEFMQNICDSIKDVYQKQVSLKAEQHKKLLGAQGLDTERYEEVKASRDSKLDQIVSLFNSDGEEYKKVLRDVENALDRQERNAA